MKTLILYLLTGVLVTIQSIAQPAIRKQIDEGSDAGEQLMAGIIRTPDGGFLGGGFVEAYPSYPSGNKTDTSRGGVDFWIVKHDKDGHIQWDKTFGGVGDDYLYVMIPTNDGGYMLGGSSTSGISGDKTDTSRGYSEDYWIIKIDSLGNKQWDKTYGGNRADDLTRMQQTKDGGYILAGSSYSDISGEKSENSFGNEGHDTDHYYTPDYWIIKIDSHGNKQWDKTYGGDNYDNCNAVMQMDDGGYMIGGASASKESGNKSQPGHGRRDIWLVKTDSLGNKQWDNSFGGKLDDQLSSFDLTKDGGYIIGATSSSNRSGNKAEDSRGFNDYWVIKTDKKGNIQWQRTMGGDFSDYLATVKQTSGGEYLVLGSTLSHQSGEISERPYGGYDLWVVKLNSDGTTKWDKLLGGSNSEFSYDHSVLEMKRDLYLIGSTSGSTISGNKTVPVRTSSSAISTSDFWHIYLEDSPMPVIAKASKQPAATNVNKAIAFTVSPNPAFGVLHVQTGRPTTLSLISQAGKPVLTKTINTRADINVSNLPAGMYYLKDHSTGAIQKVVIIR